MGIATAPWRLPLVEVPNARGHNIHNATGGRFSGLRIILLTTPSPQVFEVHIWLCTPACEWPCVAFVPDHSGGSTVDSHHLPIFVR
jgi:hypothetical protein